jgi:hypothetical protein
VCVRACNAARPLYLDPNMFGAMWAVKKVDRFLFEFLSFFMVVVFFLAGWLTVGSFFLCSSDLVVLVWSRNRDCHEKFKSA